MGDSRVVTESSISFATHRASTTPSPLCVMHICAHAAWMSNIQDNECLRSLVKELIVSAGQHLKPKIFTDELFSQVFTFFSPSFQYAMHVNKRRRPYGTHTAVSKHTAEQYIESIRYSPRVALRDD